MVGANNMVTKDVFPYYITINNKINRLNIAKISQDVLNYDSELKEIQKNIQNPDFDLDNYDLSKEIMNVLTIFISKIHNR
jgi:phage-related protein